MEYKSISFPFRISPTGSVEVAKFNDRGDVNLIRQSIIQICLTGIGERVINRNFGSEINALVFDLNDASLASLLRQSMIKALTTYEPRITVQELLVTQEESKVFVGIKYILKGINVSDAFSFSI